MTQKIELLSAEGLSKKYSQEPGAFALEPFSFTINQGQTIGIVGQSGSGKTTIARMIMGMTIPTNGVIKFKSQVLTTNRTKRQRRQIQYIFQNPYSSLDPHLTVRQILAEPLKFYFGLKGETLTSRLLGLLANVKLDRQILDKKPHELSGGQCQRIGIIRALAAQPNLIVCDEPTSALDTFNQVQVLTLLRKIQIDTHVGLVFISHALEVVYQLADYLYIFQRGHLIEEGFSTQVYTRPKTEYTRTLLESIPSRGID
ncbi:oligopeptide transporter ATP-binding protein OppF [Liquorilactobacillus ghanensis DSM 18630]|uniref:Oligopeptide transporter ATP-binding protein OppF n=1 Tax=Liquorilactobacillus ghanensis DSM 18630 TaxID=1423750 RepID=A0A0R1VK09_9LACO|nr:ATP-binding cassette domain-containing protein [Liquorilactobacillus ghanensis]KRM06208.1 oligopeptide transporter ATP-binding protein OppF [Liquorilactobacillus ghanensis DSM 18630]